MSSTTTSYLVSGSNRGIGLGLVTALASRDNVIVFAGARNPSAAEGLQALAKKYPGKFYPVKLTSGDKAENEAVAEFIQKTAGHLDVVIANAGVCKYVGPVHETPAQELRDHYEVNLVGTVILFQAVYPLLKASASPKFVAVSSISGSAELGANMHFGFFAYGASKTAANWLTRKIHAENEKFISFSINPGTVTTDMYDANLEAMPEAANFPSLTPAESARDILSVVDKATREEAGGIFFNHDGTKLPW